MRQRVFVAFVSICVIGILGISPARATFPGGNGKLALWVFGSRAPTQILTMDPDGTDREVLVPWGRNAFPAWSADGAKIAFIGTNGLITMNADGTGRFRVLEETRRRRVFERPAWSSDGTQLVFDAFVGGEGAFRIFVVNADGTGLVKLDSPGPDEYFPDWSPDGSRIAFVSSGAGGVSIETMDPDGTDRTQVTDGSGMPTWSPDGLQLTFTSGRHEDVFVVGPDGTGRTRLTDTARFELTPVFSPDGTLISFARSTGAPYRSTDIWIMDADGTSPTRITDTPRRYEIATSWQAT